jgi:hypothetical protein
MIKSSLSIREYQKKYREKNLEKNRLYQKKYYIKNRESLIKNSNKYYYENREKIIDRSSAYEKKRKLTDTLYKLIRGYRSRIRSAFKVKNWKKDTSHIKILGGDLDVCKKHIENQFREGMSWENYGFLTWHIDHIIPLSSAKTKEELMILLHYTNLQPLFAKENLQKGNKITPQPQHHAPE